MLGRGRGAAARGGRGGIAAAAAAAAAGRGAAVIPVVPVPVAPVAPVPVAPAEPAVPVAPVDPAAPPAIRFALSPATYNNDILDFSKANDIKLYAKATIGQDDKFDMQASNLKVFLDDTGTRAEAYGWQHILEIPKDPRDLFGEVDDLLTSYGTISVERVRKHAETYVGGASRAAQDSDMMKHYIMNSLTKQAKARIVLQKSEYVVNGRVSGVLLLRILIQRTSIDTNATTRFLREQLSTLPLLMDQVDSNIVAFNEKVQDIIINLDVRGETTHDLLPNMFQGYLAASDKVFVKYIEDIQGKCDEGIPETPEVDKMTTDKLMLRATQKYRTMIQGGKWNTPDEATQKIIALEATVKKLQKSSLKPKSESNKEKKSASKGDKKSDKNKTKGKDNKKPDWMLIKPKQGEPQKKTVNDKVYHWCPKHEAWTRHSPSECNGKESMAHNKDSDKQVSFSSKPTMSISKALQAIAADDGEESD